MLWVISLSAALAADPASDCLSAYGKTACGYDCEAAYGDVKCAATPQGTCKAAYGEVTCFDPTPQPVVVVVAPSGYPRGSYTVSPVAPTVASDCVSAYGQTACGYQCVQAYGEVKCAQTPVGACTSAYGQVMCWDPPNASETSLSASCVAAYGEIACGYGCESAYGKVQCSSSPGGTCKAAYGDITCTK